MTDGVARELEQAEAWLAEARQRAFDAAWFEAIANAALALAKPLAALQSKEGTN